MFSVFDGNHRLYSWMQLAEQNSHDEKYHPRVVCRILKGEKSSFVQIESAMHALNRFVGLFQIVCILLIERHWHRSD